MKKSLKKLMSLLLSLAVICTFSIPAFAADISTAGGAVKKDADTAVSDTTSTAVTSTLGMLYISDDTTVTVNKDATVTVKLVTKPTMTRQIQKLALSERSDTDGSPTDSTAMVYTGSVTPNETPAKDGKYSSTVTFTIPVEKLGQQIPISIYQSYYSSKSSSVVTGWWPTTEQQYITVANTPSVVNQLISSIYVQSRTDYTDKLCAQAKTSWDALTAADKVKVDEYDYFGRDTGDASKDSAGNGDSIGDNELLAVSFGTSFNNSRVATIKSVEDALAAANPGYSVRRGFTAQIIINHIQARDSEKIDNMEQALDRAVSNGVKNLVVQPTHLMHGAEFTEMCDTLDKYSSKISSIKVGYPLLSSESDYETIISAIKSATADYAKDPKTAIVYMGHGTDNLAHQDYAKMQQMLTASGDINYFIGTVEGKPASTDVDMIIKKVKAAGYSKVVLRPLMVVAGDHANNDMAGADADSWASKFKAAGFSVTTEIKGLGEISAIQQLYVKHAANAIDLNDVAVTSLSDSKFIKDDYYNYDGSVKNPALTVKDRKGNTLKEGTDYTVTVPSGRTSPGVYTYTINMKGSYSGTAYAMFTILNPDASKANITLSTSKYTYNGKTKKPGLSVKIGKLTLKERTDYKVTKNIGKKIGKYSYKIIFLGNYAGTTKTVTYYIAPKATTITKVKAGKKSTRISIKKQTKQTTGYQIRYSVKKSMAGAKTVTVKGAKKTSKTVKKLKSKKKYYFQVRTYKTVKGHKIVSNWSKTKSAKIK